MARFLEGHNRYCGLSTDLSLSTDTFNTVLTLSLQVRLHLRLHYLLPVTALVAVNLAVRALFLGGRAAFKEHKMSSSSLAEAAARGEG